MSKIARYLSQRNQKQIAKIVSAEPVASAEPMREKLHQQIFFLAQRNHAIAQVSRGQHVEVFAQAAGRATVVGYGDNRGKVCDQRRLRAGLAGHTHVTSQTTQQRGKPGAAADGYYS
jgi:hypothetical protein